jgi:hypothetical protein
MNLSRCCPLGLRELIIIQINLLCFAGELCQLANRPLSSYDYVVVPGEYNL